MQGLIITGTRRCRTRGAGNVEHRETWGLSRLLWWVSLTLPIPIPKLRPKSRCGSDWGSNVRSQDGAQPRFLKSRTGIKAASCYIWVILLLAKFESLHPIYAFDNQTCRAH